jgi:hypothetical protein
MHIDVDPPEGGILLVGDSTELKAIAQTILDADENGEAEGSLLTDDGVETVRVIRKGPIEEEDADPDPL